MKVRYDPDADVLSILLSDAPVEESDPVGLNGGDKAGVILDYDKVHTAQSRISYGPTD